LYLIIIGVSGILPGGLSAKAVAQSFWHREVEGERQEIGLRGKLIFASEKSSELSGTYDDAMKFIDAIRCDSLYSHECSANCKVKGSWNTCTVNTV
jgi:hypothetical protein